MHRAIFGGSFNPVHRGHLDIVQFLVRWQITDEVILLIAGNPPHKNIADDNPAQRVMFLQEAVSGLPHKERKHVRIDDTECRRPDTIGYTIDQLRRLDKEFPHSRWSLVIGMDSLFDFTTWKNWQDILEHTAVWVAPRFQNEESRLGFETKAQNGNGPFVNPQLLREAGAQVPDEQFLTKLETAGGQIQFLGVAPTEISSTQLRAPGPSHWRELIPVALHSNTAFRRRYQLRD